MDVHQAWPRMCPLHFYVSIKGVHNKNGARPERWPCANRKSFSHWPSKLYGISGEARCDGVGGGAGPQLAHPATREQDLTRKYIVDTTQRTPHRLLPRG